MFPGGLLVALLSAVAALGGSAVVGPPAPNAPLPKDPAALAQRLAETDDALAQAIDRWRAEGSLESFPPPDDVTLLALHQQRIHLFLTARRRVARRVTALLSPRIAAHL